MTSEAVGLLVHSVKVSNSWVARTQAEKRTVNTNLWSQSSSPTRVHNCIEHVKEDVTSK